MKENLWKFQKWLINHNYKLIYAFFCKIGLMHQTIYELF